MTLTSPRWTLSRLLPAVAAAALVSLACSSNNNNSSSNKPATTAPTQAAASASATSATTATKAPTTAASTPASSPAAAATTGKVTKIAYVPNWFAEPENGGELMAKLLNYFPKDLDVDIRNGGPSVNASQLLTSGQIQFTLCAADSILTFKEQGVDLVGVMAGFQKNPQVLISHKEAALTGFQDMKGKAVAVSSFQYYYPYLQKKYGWSENDKQTYEGSIAPFLANKSLVEQGYYTAEPYLIDKQGQKYDVWSIADAGFNPFASLLCTTKDFADKNPAIVKEFVQAAQKGWLAMMKPENQKILSDEIAKRNEQEDAGSVKYALDKMPDLMFNDDTKANGFGHMSDAAWVTTMNQLVDAKVLKGPVDVKSLYTNQYLDPSLKAPADVKADAAPLLPSKQSGLTGTNIEIATPSDSSTTLIGLVRRASLALVAAG